MNSTELTPGGVVDTDTDGSAIYLEGARKIESNLKVTAEARGFSNTDETEPFTILEMIVTGN